MLLCCVGHAASSRGGGYIFIMAEYKFTQKYQEKTKTSAVHVEIPQESELRQISSVYTSIFLSRVLAISLIPISSNMTCALPLHLSSTVMCMWTRAKAGLIQSPEACSRTHQLLLTSHATLYLVSECVV